MNTHPADSPTQEITSPTARYDRIGLLIVNLGTPDGTSYWAIRRYLKEFLSDRRVVETSRLIWWPILNLVILAFRPFKSGKLYATVWNRERNESPLRTITRAQAERLGAAFRSEPDVRVEWAMRYGMPSIASRMKALAEDGCDRILLFPLYPQYSATTTASVCDAAFRTLATQRRQPAIRVVPAYFDSPVYIAALAQSIRAQIAALPFEPEVVLASFHGLPKDYVRRGDPYETQCLATVARLREALGWDENRLRMTFQSRFGPTEWLTPYTAETAEALAKAGTRSLAVVAPGFVADCVETLEEIALGCRDTFLAAGGQNFAALSCLNDTAEGIIVLETVARQQLAGWL